MTDKLEEELKKEFDDIVENASETEDAEVKEDVTDNSNDSANAEAAENENANENANEETAKKDKKDLLIDELNDKYKRTMAEFDNYRKRTEKEKSAMYEIGAKDIIEKILPVVDNFERGFKTLSEEDKANPFVDGMDRVYKQLMTTLEEAGVKAIEAVGSEFDPNYHNAVMHVEDENFGDNTVCEEFQKGYTYRDSVVRHSMVKVAN